MKYRFTLLKKYKKIRLPILVFFLSFAVSDAHSQIYLKNNPNKYYETLIKTLSNPDSLYVYEVNSSWGSGIACFISFKNSIIKSGYYLNSNFIYRQLAPRNIMPPDSLNVFRIIYSNPDNIKKLLSEIGHLQIFKLRNEENIKDKCTKDFITDGNYYQFSKMINHTYLSKNYYEIYEYAKLCPTIKEYKSFVKLDKLFQQHFNESQLILKNLISEYSERNKKLN